MPTSRDALTVGTSEIAALCGVTVRQVSNWRREGCPTKNAAGNSKYYVPDVVKWLREREREIALASVTRGRSHGDDDAARKLAAEADLKELELAQKRGELVPLSDYDRALDTVIGGLVAGVQGQLRSYERMVVIADTPGEARRLMDQLGAALMRAAQATADTWTDEPASDDATEVDDVAAE